MFRTGSDDSRIRKHTFCQPPIRDWLLSGFLECSRLMLCPLCFFIHIGHAMTVTFHYFSSQGEFSRTDYSYLTIVGPLPTILACIPPKFVVLKIGLLLPWVMSTLSLIQQASTTNVCVSNMVQHGATSHQ